LLDFGLAKETSGNTLGGRSVFGYSRRYSPLEQIEGVGTDPRSDLFSLGATVFHLLTGKQPIDVVARASAIVAGRPDPLQLASDLNPEVPSAVANVIWTSMALNADLRFASANAMKNALEDAVQLSEEPATEEAETVAPLIAPVEDAPASFHNSFPALEAFIEETEDVSNANITEPISQTDEMPPAADGPKGVVKIPIDSRPGYHEWLRPAMAALTVILIIAMAYVLLRSGSSSDPGQTEPQDQNTVVQESVASDTEEPPASTEELPSTTQRTSAVAGEERSDPKKSSIKRKETKIAKDNNDERDEVEPIREVRDVPPVVRRSQNLNKRRQMQRRERFARQPEFREPPVITIETIFTGIPYGRRYRRQPPY